MIFTFSGENHSATKQKNEALKYYAWLNANLQNKELSWRIVFLTARNHGL